MYYGVLAVNNVVNYISGCLQFHTFSILPTFHSGIHGRFFFNNGIILDIVQDLIVSVRGQSFCFVASG